LTSRCTSPLTVASGTAIASVWLICLAPVLAIRSSGTMQPQPDVAPPVLTLAAPTSESLLIGPTEFEARLPSTVALARVEFFVDGVLACSVTSAPLRCTWNAGAEMKSRTVRAVATLESGQRLTETVRTSSHPNLVENVDVRSVLVPAVVTDGNGRFVQGLTREEFQLFENDRPVAISHFEAEDAPLAVVLTLDLSASMQRALPEVRNAIRRFVSALNPTDRVTVLGFTERMYVLADGTRDSVLQGQTLDGLSAGGSTALYDAIVYAIGRGRGSTGRHAVVVVSDGADMASQAELDSVERFVQSSDVTLYTITVGEGAKNRRVRTIMERLAERSGGRTFSGGGVSEVVEALGLVRDDLAHQYLLAYSPESDAAAGYRRIRVVAGSGRYRVRTRNGHQPSPSSPVQSPSVR
jgi:Ca-activated chloride channel family protein